MSLGLAPLNKLMGPIVGGFVVAYGAWAYQMNMGTKNLPHTISPEWENATFKMNANKERVAAAPIPLNPRHVL